MFSRLFSISLITAPCALADSGAGGMTAGIIQFAPFIAIFALMYFLILRPQQKREKERQAMVSALKRGDRVITSSGIIGVVHKIVNDDEILLEVAEDVRVRFVRSSIGQVLSRTEPMQVSASQNEEAEQTENASTSKPKASARKPAAKASTRKKASS